jgi:hypothetical protein
VRQDTRRDPEADYPDVGPSRTEIETWAENERRWRGDLMPGPTEGEKRAWAFRERRRRRLALADHRFIGDPEVDDVLEAQRSAQRVAELAAEGAWSLLFNLPVRVLVLLIREGRTLEEGRAAPRSRRRIRLRDRDL